MVECPYPLLERVKLEIAAAQGILGEVSYGAQVRLPALLPVEHWPAYAARITELTAGKIAAEKLGETFQAARWSPLRGRPLIFQKETLIFRKYSFYS